MKPHDHATMKTSVTTLSQCTILTLTVVVHPRIGRRIMGHFHNKHTQGPSTRDSINTPKEAAQGVVAAVEADALTQSNLRTACTMTMKLTTAPNTTPSS
jgi:hypothetical protein